MLEVSLGKKLDVNYRMASRYLAELARGKRRMNSVWASIISSLINHFLTC
jgi:hypothetical protein